MRLDPECSRCTARIKAQLLPPPWFVAVTMELAVMSAAQWDGELVTDFAPEGAILCKPQMMGIAWLTTIADKAGLLKNKAHNDRDRANGSRLTVHKDGFVDRQLVPQLSVATSGRPALCVTIGIDDIPR